MLAFNLWLDDLIDHHGQQQVETSAKRTIAIGDGRIGQAVASLARIAERNVAPCSAEHLALMREAAFRTAPIKEIAVLDADGQPRCADLVSPLAAHEVVGPRRIGAPGET